MKKEQNMKHRKDNSKVIKNYSVSLGKKHHQRAIIRYKSNILNISITGYEQQMHNFKVFNSNRQKKPLLKKFDACKIIKNKTLLKRILSQCAIKQKVRPD